MKRKRGRRQRTDTRGERTYQWSNQMKRIQSKKEKRNGIESSMTSYREWNDRDELKTLSIERNFQEQEQTLIRNKLKLPFENSFVLQKG